MAQSGKKSSADKSTEVATQSKVPAPRSRGLTSFEDIEHLFDQYFSRNWFRPFHPARRLDDLWGTYEMHAPNMDVIDRDNEVVVRVELPGVDKKDLDITVSENTLTVSGTSSMDSKEEKGNYYRSECKKGSISRSIALPRYVDSANINATFNNGLLELTIPKSEKSKAKKVKVS